MGRLPSVASIVLNDFTHDSRVLKEARSLRDQGFQVTVVALHATGLPERESIDGFAVHRIRLSSRSWSKHGAIQVLKYLEFIVRAVSAYRRFDVLHCHDLEALPVGVLVKLFLNRRAKVVYDAHEYETEIDGLTPLQKWACRILEKALIRHADRVITVSESIANEYSRLYGIPKPCLILNTPPYVKPEPSDLLRKELGLRKDQRIFLMQGALSPGRGIELMLDSAALRSDDQDVFVFMGYGALEPTVRHMAEKHRNIFLKPAVHPDRILEYSASADYGICLIEDKALSYRYSLPNKMFEYIMAGIPVICSDLPEMRRVVENYEVGVVARDATPAGIDDAIQRALQLDRSKLKANLAIASRHFNWKEQEAVLTRIYREIGPPLS